MPWTIVAPLVGAAVGLYGAKKSSDAAKQAQGDRNAAVDAQFEYDKQAWQTPKRRHIETFINLSLINGAIP